MMRLKFITLNVEHGGKLMDNILSFLNDEKPDLLFLQEVYNSNDSQLESRFRTVEVLRKEIGEFLPYSDFRGIAFDPEVKADMGNAIFSKFHLSNCGSKFFDVPYGEVSFTGYHEPVKVPRAVQYSDIDINGKNTLLLNLHGIWATNGTDSERRINMAKDIAEILKGKESIILAGDTNFTTDAVKTIEIIESKGVKSVFGDSLVSTFNMRHKTNPAYASAAVDMIFVSSDFRVISKEMPEVDVSDHYPLVATIEL